MKRLHLLRHAKSSWDDPSLPDRERPLAARGERAAKAIARHMGSEDIAPDLVLCSPAVRAKQTLHLIREATAAAREAVEPELYGASVIALLSRLRRVEEGVWSVLLIGHNPGIHELAVELATSGERLSDLRAKFPTGALATLELEGRWAQLGPGRATLVEFVKPRELE